MEGVRVREPGEGEGGGGGGGVGVVDQDPRLVLGGDRDDVEVAGGRVADDALVVLGAEADRLPVFEPDDRFLGQVLVLEDLEGAVVEDVAVLVDLDERRAVVVGGLPQHLGEVLAVGVDRAGHEGGLRAERERHRVEGGVQGAHRGRLGDLADLGGGAVLALGQPVDPVVEEQDLEVDVAPEGVDQVVAADGQRVAVARDDPDGQVAAGGGEAGGDGRGAAVDRVHPVGVHVVREAGGAADAGDEDDVLLRQAQFGHEALDGGEHRVVTAAGAPADLLVRLEVLHGLLGLGLGDQLEEGLGGLRHR